MVLDTTEYSIIGNLDILTAKRITIANFPELFDKFSSENKRILKKSIKKYSEHTKWLSGKANFPLWVFFRFCRLHKLAVFILKEARFSARGVSSNFRIKLPLVVDENLSYFLGVLAGDGYISKPKAHQRGAWTVQMWEGDYHYQTKIYAPLVQRLFGTTPKLRLSKRKDGRQNFYSSINSFILVLYLTKILNIKNGYKVNRISIPKVIYNNESLYIKTAFIQGLFDTDGTATSGTVKYSTVSKRLYYQVKKILDYAEIFYSTNTWLKNERSRLLYTIRIRKKSLKDFRHRVGFKNIKKKIRLNNMLAP